MRVIGWAAGPEAHRSGQARDNRPMTATDVVLDAIALVEARLRGDDEALANDASQVVVGLAAMARVS